MISFTDLMDRVADRRASWCVSLAGTLSCSPLEAPYSLHKTAPLRLSKFLPAGVILGVQPLLAYAFRLFLIGILVVDPVWVSAAAVVYNVAV